MKIRTLKEMKDQILIIELESTKMPYFIGKEELKDFEVVENAEHFLISEAGQDIVNKRFTMIADVLPVIASVKARSEAIKRAAAEFNVSSATIRNYLCVYLREQCKEALAPKEYRMNPTENEKEELTKDEKNMRWALNKFYYTKHKNTLMTAYRLLLKNKYCSADGVLFSEYPSYYQFRYFYRKTKNIQKESITRNGLKFYQRNERPCVGDGVQQFASASGVGMLDATICDIYLVNEAGHIVGRPILTACVDAYSGLLCGYSLSWEGGVYSLRNLMLNVMTDKVQWCNQFGIKINEEDWPSNKMPARLVTDMGSEYKSENFEQIAELGITLTNLPPYRPELKGPVEKFFDIIQGYFKPYLKGKGVIEPDFQERGAHDYRKDACLTIEDFEKVLLHCIIFYNSKRLLDKFPYDETMLEKKIKPYASHIWIWGCSLPSSNLLDIDKKKLILTLLPRTIGKFSRFGLKVNKMRYHNENYTEKYLQGKECTVAYNPDDTSSVWVLDNKTYQQFDLIESRYKGKELETVEQMKLEQRNLIKDEEKKNIQAEINLAEHILDISKTATFGIPTENTTKNIRQTRKKEQTRKRIDFVREVAENE